jgi:hypothetical protein
MTGVPVIGSVRHGQDDFHELGRALLDKMNV